ncbi:hypothetical protein SAY86_003878 [Trapa natans]|uniref:Biogenesis of lysosome-related organelles complex 1 subunit 7 n=1 Tax=Trapa natans TaxID=22666 RepID=A0AAN7RN86_TRANT|nr:hypothetical protein SAY86_003878 [Trapa natans]
MCSLFGILALVSICSSSTRSLGEDQQSPSIFLRLLKFQLYNGFSENGYGEIGMCCLLFSLAELDQLLDDAPSPFIMQHAARISNVRKRVTSLNAVLRSVQRRVDNIDRMLSVGLPHGMILFNCRSKNGFSGLVLSNKFGLYHISTGKMIAMCALILL